MNAPDLYKRYTLEDLQNMAAAIREDPDNQQSGSLYLYTPKARKKLDAIAYAITWHLRDRKEAEHAND
jgi:hypothetical protein